MYRVYELHNHSGRRYFGISSDVETRLAQHNAGESTWTAKFRPGTLVWQSREVSLGEARKLENKLKRQKGGDGIQALKASSAERRVGNERGILGSHPRPAPNFTKTRSGAPIGFYCAPCIASTNCITTPADATSVSLRTSKPVSPNTTPASPPGPRSSALGRSFGKAVKSPSETPENSKTNSNARKAATASRRSK